MRGLRKSGCVRAQCSCGQRGVALVLVMIAMVIAAALSYSFVAAQSTSLSISRNVENQAKARYIAEAGLRLAVSYVHRESTWRADQPNGLWVTDASFAGGTYTIEGEDGWDSDGSGAIGVPAEGDGDLTDDDSEAFTLTVTGRIGGCSSQVQAVITPVPVALKPMIIYGDGKLKNRIWTGSGWSGEYESSDTSSQPVWVVAAACPVRPEIAAATVSSNKQMNLVFYDGSTWSAPVELASSVGNTSERVFHLAYEQLSGELLIAYRVGNNSTLSYRTWDGESLSSESNLVLPTSSSLKWVRLLGKPGSDEIMAITLDNSKDVAAAVWSGSAWTSTILLETDAKTSGDEGIAAAYEQSSGDGLVAWSNNSVNSFQYRTWSGGSWSNEADGPLMGNKEPKWVHMTSHPTSNEIILGALDPDNQIFVTVWNGSSFSTALQVESNAPNDTSREFDMAYESGGSEAVFAWGRGGVDNYFFRRWNGVSWSAEQAGPGLHDRARVVQLVPDSLSDKIFVSILNGNTGRLEFMLWNGDSMGAPVELAGNVSGSNAHEAYMAVAPKLLGEGALYVYDAQWTP